MTQNEKDLLLKDLCARLPYGVMAKFGDSNPSKITNITQCIDSDSNSWFVESDGESDGMICPINNVKPYLFPLSSMTEEQRKEYHELLYNPENGINIDYFDWCHKNRLDYRHLIPMGLAIDATNLNIY